jgi:hypothetical protein
MLGRQAEGPRLARAVDHSPSNPVSRVRGPDVRPSKSRPVAHRPTSSRSNHRRPREERLDVMVKKYAHTLGRRSWIPSLSLPGAQMKGMRIWVRYTNMRRYSADRRLRSSSQRCQAVRPFDESGRVDSWASKTTSLWLVCSSTVTCASRAEPRVIGIQMRLSRPSWTR